MIKPSVSETRSASTYAAERTGVRSSGLLKNLGLAPDETNKMIARQMIRQGMQLDAGNNE